MTVTTDIVQKLWTFCHDLRRDGVSYMAYVTELTYLLFLKMAAETGIEQELPKGYRWRNLLKGSEKEETPKEGIDKLKFYSSLLAKLGSQKESKRIQAIYKDAKTLIKKPRILEKLITSIDALDWYSAQEEGLGNLYEGLLEKTAGEKKSKAGQYFTPRPLIDLMVALMQPQAGELIQDPAAGAGGFLIAADRYIKQQTDDLFDLSESLQSFQQYKAFYGMELVPDAHRLLLMNMVLHRIEGEVKLGDTLSNEGKALALANLILTNPPFGRQGGDGRPTRDDFTFPTSNKELAFLQHIYRGLQPEGRAAVVVPDGVLGNEGQKVRGDLMDKCNLHTVLRLPTGIFYSPGVKTNVLFFQRGKTEKGNTKAVWFYDLRTNMPGFGKRTPLTRGHLAEFEGCYGKDPNGGSRRKDLGEEGRFRKFSREDIAKRGDNLDISWLRDESLESGEDLPEPAVIASEIMERLQVALSEMDELMLLLDEEEK